MTRLINEQEVPKITTEHLDRVEVRCRTCHHGQPRPWLIEDALSAAYTTGGLDSLSTRYEELRKQYYGSDTYDFGEHMLPALAERLSDPGNTGAMIELARFNLRWFPESGFAHLVLGQAHATAGDKEKAIEELNRAVELDGRLEENAQRIIDQLQSK